MEKLLSQLPVLLPNVRFEPGESFFWSPHTATVTYQTRPAEEPRDTWALLHEAAHAFLEHHTYQSDMELLLLEVAAWRKAKEMAQSLGILIDEDHIQDCLDTYRDWLHKRSTCPRCSTVSLQVSSNQYGCHNCGARWHVSASRFCRPYRLGSSANKKPSPKSETTFR